MSQETFAEYTTFKFNEQHLDKYKQIIEKMGVVGYLESMIPDIRGKYRQDLRTCYDFIVKNCQYLYKAAPDIPGLKTLMEGLYDIDTKCGSEASSQSLAALDRDREHFKMLFKQHREKITDPVMKTIFEEFSRLIFRFNGYQAPSRLDPAQAIRDAMGQTDLFGEMLNQL